MQERGAPRVARADELDRSLARARRRAAPRRPGRRARPPRRRARRDRARARVRHGVPQRERPLEVARGLRQAEDGLCLARRLDRRRERLGAAPGRRPVRRELGGRGGGAARELVGEPRVQLLALAGEDRRVDGLRQQRVAEAEAAARLVGDEHAVLDRLRAATRARRARAGPRRRRAAGRRRRARPPRRRAAGSASGRRARSTRAAARRAGRAGARRCSPAAASSSSAKNGLPSARATMASSATPAAAPRAARPAPSRSSGPSSSTSAEPERRTPSARRRMRSADDGSSRAVGREQHDPPVARRCARGRRRDRASTCRPSAGPRAPAAPARGSPSSASARSNTRSCEPPPRRELAERRSASTNGWYGSSVPTRSIERPSRTSKPASRARRATSEASRVLPMPASPATRTVAPLPARAASSARSSSSSSRARPTNAALVRAFIGQYRAVSPAQADEDKAREARR